MIGTKDGARATIGAVGARSTIGAAGAWATTIDGTTIKTGAMDWARITTGTREEAEAEAGATMTEARLMTGAVDGARITTGTRAEAQAGATMAEAGAAAFP